jgi:predicted nucleic acid-binding protein
VLHVGGLRRGFANDTLHYRTALPGPLYCDTSALLKLYLTETGSVDFTRVVGGRSDLLISDLAVTEVASVLSRRVRQGAISPDDAHRIQRTIIGSLDDAGYACVELTRDVHRRAEHFLLTLTDTPLREADALHLALAVSARAASMASFDGRLAAAARAIGLAVYPAVNEVPVTS